MLIQKLVDLILLSLTLSILLTILFSILLPIFLLFIFGLLDFWLEVLLLVELVDAVGEVVEFVDLQELVDPLSSIVLHTGSDDLLLGSQQV